MSTIGPFHVMERIVWEISDLDCNKFDLLEPQFQLLALCDCFSQAVFTLSHSTNLLPIHRNFIKYLKGSD